MKSSVERKISELPAVDIEEAVEPLPLAFPALQSVRRTILHE
jgi:hypothetical protein